MVRWVDSDWRENVAKAKAELLGRMSEQVLTAAQAAAPVDTGRLLRSLRKTIDGDTARIGSDLDYSVWVEDGHRVAYRGADGLTHYTGDVVPPQPYLRPALYGVRP